MSNRLKGVDHVGIVVRDLNKSAAWYEQHLGFKRLYEYGFPGVKALFIANDDIRLELFETEGASPMAPERTAPSTNLKIGGINHVALAVDDLDAAIRELKAGGVEVASEPRDVPDGHGDRFAFIHDNEGMIVELFENGPGHG